VTAFVAFLLAMLSLPLDPAALNSCLVYWLQLDDRTYHFKLRGGNNKSSRQSNQRVTNRVGAPPVRAYIEESDHR
jgi:hypothetical protein